MAEHIESRLLPFSCDQLFGLVLDIEHYPEFVPGYRHAQVLTRQADVLLVEQEVGVGPLVFRFHSRAAYSAPGSIHVVAGDGPFRRFEVRWTFSAEAGACRVTATTLYQAGGLLAPALDSWIGQIAPRLLQIFARRAQTLYGSGHSALN